MARIKIYTKKWCPWCNKAKALLRSRQLEYDEIDVTSDAMAEQAMVRRARARTVPQIFIDERPIGGYDDLARLDATGDLIERLNSGRHHRRTG